MNHIYRQTLSAFSVFAIVVMMASVSAFAATPELHVSAREFIFAYLNTLPKGSAGPTTVAFRTPESWLYGPDGRPVSIAQSTGSVKKWQHDFPPPPTKRATLPQPSLSSLAKILKTAGAGKLPVAAAPHQWTIVLFTKDTCGPSCQAMKQAVTTLQHTHPRQLRVIHVAIANM